MSCIPRFLFAPLLLALGSCAYVDAVPLPVCYPFLKVNGAEMSLLKVPNPNKLTAARFGAFLAKNKVDATFGDCGPPQNLKADMDSTAVPIEILKFLTEAQKGGALFSRQERAATVGRVIQIFEFEFDKDGTFVGLKPLIRPRDLIRIPDPAAMLDDSGADDRPTNTPPANTPPANTPPSNNLQDPLKGGG
jgi:hypothetical protein